MSAHILDRPVWNALNTRDSHFALGGELARRFQPDISPLSSARDDSSRALSALAELVPAEGVILLLQAEPIVIPPGVATVSTASGVQMTADRLLHSPGEICSRIEPLNEKDWPEMFALATLTKPGPFERGTPKLGEFFGVREGGRLIAMAGERMKVPGYEEVSGVCVHPDARGRGLARELSAFVARRVFERGAIPFLHSYSTNTAAIRLYETLGFTVRSQVNVAGLTRA